MTKSSNPAPVVRRMEEVINISSEPVTFTISDRAGQPPYQYEVPPGGTEKIQPGYCRPRPTSAEDKFLPPIIVTRTQGRIVPVASPEGQAYLEQRTGGSSEKSAEPPGVSRRQNEKR